MDQHFSVGNYYDWTFIKLVTYRDDNPGESRPRDPGESDILGPGFSPGFIDGIPGLQE